MNLTVKEKEHIIEAIKNNQP